MYNTLQNYLTSYPTPGKRKVFISYHHKDQQWVDYFKRLFSETYNIFTDCSLDQAIESDDLDYVHRSIREDYITGTSITIVICGSETGKRKCVDWEIYATLDKNHALLAIALPHNRVSQNGQIVRIVPNRLHNNIQSGYAYWIDWTENAAIISKAIEEAISLSTRNRDRKHNLDSKMGKNL